MRILITGRDGQVGWELQRCLAHRGEVFALGRAALDLANEDQIRHCVRSLRPNWIVNAAAYTAVDKAETEPRLAAAINARAPEILAEEAARISASLIHYSTDYVYDGNKTTPYVETDRTNPVSTYGRTKLEGERAVVSVGGDHLIFRTSWVYAGRGKNFLLTMLRLANERSQLRVVSDQFGAPTWSRAIAQATAAAIATTARGAGGIYHLSANGRTSWHGFARRIVELGATAGLCPDVPVQAIATSEYPTPAQRPANSLLCTDKLSTQFGIRLPDWDESLRQCLAELAPTTPIYA